jgi:hypothetical protein
MNLNDAIEAALNRREFHVQDLRGSWRYGRFHVSSHGAVIAAYGSTLNAWEFGHEYDTPVQALPHYHALRAAVIGAPPPPTVAKAEDFLEPDRLRGLLGKTHWAILTAANPRGQQLSDEDNAARMDYLREDLALSGSAILHANGRYGGQDEPCFVALNIAQSVALDFAKWYGQESILTRQGLVFTDGSPTIEPTGIVAHDEAPDDDFTRVIGFDTPAFTVLFEG